VTRNISGQPYKGGLPQGTSIRPGDTIEIAERWF
jgi:hypothetical protein